METIEQSQQSCKTDTRGSNFIIKVDDGFCEWEYGFTAKKACIDDFICAIEERLNIKRDYEKSLRIVNTKPTLEDMETKPEQAPESTQKTETQIKLDREKFSFTRNGCLIELHIYYNNRDYKLLYHNKATQDNHETLLELQLEAVRFAKKRLSEPSGNYPNN